MILVTEPDFPYLEALAPFQPLQMKVWKKILMYWCIYCDVLMRILLLLFALGISNHIPLYVIVGVLLSNWHRLEFFPSKQTDERSETRTSGCSGVVCSTSFKLIPQNRHGCWLCKAINIYNRSKVVFLYAWNTGIKLRI